MTSSRDPITETLRPEQCPQERRRTPFCAYFSGRPFMMDVRRLMLFATSFLMLAVSGAQAQSHKSEPRRSAPAHRAAPVHHEAHPGPSGGVRNYGHHEVVRADHSRVVA